MVRDAIAKLHTGKSQDHDGLVAEHLRHEGFPESWSTNTSANFKAGDPMTPGNYRTIMISHTLAKLYASVLEHELSHWAEREGVRAHGQAGFRRGFSTMDHIFTLRAIIDEGRAHGKRIYCCFVDFRKAFDMVPRARLVQRLYDLGVPNEITWGILALYETVTGRVRTPGGILDIIQSTIGVKQGCPLSPTLFGLHIDEVSEYIDRDGDRGAPLLNTWIPLLLYADDLVLISDSPEGLQSQLDTLQRFAHDRDLCLNLSKTKARQLSLSPKKKDS
ncbi:hypothetical protein L7F22_017053 [Adiantum nelumboides]|nr:hypothetical protein [Adiantum nelumboides]